MAQNNTLKQLGTVLMTAGIFGLFWWAGSRPEDRSTNASMSPENRTECRVLTVYDGDTIGCDLDGDGKIQKPKEQIRLLGIDTPERHYSKKNKRRHQQRGSSKELRDEPWAIEASRLTETLDKKMVYLEYDKETHDKYGRTLAYVYPTKKATESMSEKLLKEGFATIMIFPPNTRDKEKLKSAEYEARQNGLGLWSD